MSSPRVSRSLPLRAGAMAVAAGLALPALPVVAQAGASNTSEFPNLVPVAVWTGVVAVGALLVTSVGYLYRRKRGLDHPLHPPPPGVELEQGHGLVNPLEPTAGHEVTPHDVREHGLSGAADVVEQAAVMHDGPGDH